MPSQYTKSDKLIGMTNWIGYIISAPIRILEYAPAPGFLNVFEDGIRPRLFIEKARKRRVGTERSSQSIRLDKLV